MRKSRFWEGSLSGFYGRGRAAATLPARLVRPRTASRRRWWENRRTPLPQRKDAMRTTAALLIALAAGIAPAAAQGAPEMTFRLVDAPNLCKRCDVVEASGQIAFTSIDRFNEFAAREKIGGKPLVVVVNSGGGSVRGGWALGRKLRALKASVIAAAVSERPDGAIEFRPGSCISMCNSVLSAGVDRRISPGTVFGVHQFAPTSERFRNLDNAVTVRDMSDQLRMLSEWLAYAREMKIDQRLVEAQLSVPFEKIDFISHETLAAWKIVTAPSAALPKLLRNPKSGADSVAASPTTALHQISTAAGASAAPQPTRPGDRQWSPPRVTGDWREAMVESYADFLRVNIGCSAPGRVFLQITLRGVPEARQKAMAQQVVMSGGFEIVDRPVDISQITMGFGATFWMRAALRPDQITKFASSGGRLNFTPSLSPDDSARRNGFRIETTGFDETVPAMLAACEGKKAEAGATPRS
jgi:hypothetical protein